MTSYGFTCGSAQVTPTTVAACNDVSVTRGTRRLALLLPPARKRVVDGRLLELCDAASAATEWVRLTELRVLDGAAGGVATVSAASC